MEYRPTRPSEALCQSTETATQVQCANFQGIRAKNVGGKIASVAHASFRFLEMPDRHPPLRHRLGAGGTEAANRCPPPDTDRQ